MLTVSNMRGASGRKVTNQFIIENDCGTVTFQSYNSTIATIVKPCNGELGIVSIGEDWDSSRTTAKYRCAFMREQGFSELASKQGIERALKEGYANSDSGDIYRIAIQEGTRKYS